MNRPNKKDYNLNDKCFSEINYRSFCEDLEEYVKHLEERLAHRIRLHAEIIKHNNKNVENLEKYKKALDEALWELARDCIGYSKEEICFDKAKEKCIECRKQDFIKEVEQDETL